MLCFFYSFPRGDFFVIHPLGDSRAPTSLRSPTSNAHTLPRASMQPKMKKLPEQPSFLYRCTFPSNKLMSMCLYTKNEPYRTRSSFWLAEREGFEPPEPLSSTVFKTAAIDHSAISPRNRLQKYCFFFKYTNFLQKFLPICEKYSNFAPKIVQNVPTDTQIEDSPRDGDRSKPRIYW